MVLKKLDQPPDPQYEDYLQADYVELLCLANPNRRITRYDIFDRMREDADLDINNDFDLNSVGTGFQAETYDDHQAQIEKWFENIWYRSQALGELYPFSISHDKQELSRKGDLSDNQKLYVFLLIASCLRNVAKLQNEITSSFEVLSHIVLKMYVGGDAQVHLFGLSSANQGRYQGRKYDKIKKLSDDLYELVKIPKDHFDQHDRGDAGLDVVAWLPFGDKSNGMVVILAQCACTANWVNKQHSSSYDTWNRLIDFTLPPVNMVFIPFSFRDAAGVWWDKTRIHSSVLVDRLRMMTVLSKTQNPFDILPDSIHELIDEILGFSEDIV